MQVYLLAGVPPQTDVCYLQHSRLSLSVDYGGLINSFQPLVGVSLRGQRLSEAFISHLPRAGAFFMSATEHFHAD